MTSSSTEPLAPMPPDVGHSIQSYQSDYIYPSDAGMYGAHDFYASPQVVSSPVVEAAQARLAMTKEVEQKKCRMKDRFDRKDVLAYEWGRNRLAVDLDGLNVGFNGVSEFEAVKLEYKLRLQREKTRREKCRYPSAWQGIIGSGYNELIVREEQTVWEELRKIKDDARKFLDEAL